MKTLIIEDDIISQNLLRKILQKYGDVQIASNGEIGLKIIKESIDKNIKIDLICLDIMMPKLSGTETLFAIRKYELEHDILDGVKIIMTTALNDFDTIKYSFEEQCDGYIIKPIIRRKLEELMIKLEIIDDSGEVNE